MEYILTFKEERQYTSPTEKIEVDSIRIVRPDDTNKNNIIV
jgi:hypothetical protein